MTWRSPYRNPLRDLIGLFIGLTFLWIMAWAYSDDVKLATWLTGIALAACVPGAFRCVLQWHREREVRRGFRELKRAIKDLEKP